MGAVEIEFEGSKYLIVPPAAILILMREDEPPGPEELEAESGAAWLDV